MTGGKGRAPWSRVFGGPTRDRGSSQTDTQDVSLGEDMCLPASPRALKGEAAWLRKQGIPCRFSSLAESDPRTSLILLEKPLGPHYPDILYYEWPSPALGKGGLWYVTDRIDVIFENLREAEAITEPGEPITRATLLDAAVLATNVDAMQRENVMAALARLAVSERHGQRHLAHSHPWFPQVEDSVRVQSYLMHVSGK